MIKEIICIKIVMITIIIMIVVIIIISIILLLLWLLMYNITIHIDNLLVINRKSHLF